MLSADQISTTPCPTCKSLSHKKMWDVFDHEYQSTEQTFPLNSCSECGTVYLSPRPNLKALNIIYPTSYNNYHTDVGEISYVRRISNRLQAQRIKKVISKYLKKPNFRILDVGCGDGYVLDRIKEVFPHAETFGVEPSREAAEIAGKKHKVFAGIIEDYVDDQTYDLVVSSHVIEHVADPVGFLIKLKSFVSVEGVMIIDTPNIDCLQARIFGKHWGGIHAPRHWTLFGISTLNHAAQRAGLKEVSIEELPINTFLVWSVHSWLYEKPAFRGIANRFFDPVKCVSSKSFYYLGLMVFAEILERLTKLFNLGLGQQRAVFRRPQN